MLKSFKIQAKSPTLFKILNVKENITSKWVKQSLLFASFTCSGHELLKNDFLKCS